MTRYFLFEYNDYYPRGGFNDLTGVFESENDALADIKSGGVWQDNVEIHSLNNGDDEPELLYHRFSVLDDSNEVWFVIGNSEKKIIKLVGVVKGKARWPESYRDAKMDDFKMEVE